MTEAEKLKVYVFPLRSHNLHVASGHVEYRSGLSKQNYAVVIFKLEPVRWFSG